MHNHVIYVLNIDKDHRASLSFCYLTVITTDPLLKLQLYCLVQVDFCSFHFAYYYHSLSLTCYVRKRLENKTLIYFLN